MVVSTMNEVVRYKVIRSKGGLVRSQVGSMKSAHDLWWIDFGPIRFSIFGHLFFCPKTPPFPNSCQKKKKKKITSHCFLLHIHFPKS